MYIYLLETYVLSIVAAVLYGVFIRPFAAPKYRKYALLSMIGLSLSLPFILDNWAEKQGGTVCLHEHPVTEVVCVDYCPNPDELPTCYEIALLQERFCECRAVSKENLLVFRQNRFYDSCLAFSYFVNKIIFIPAVALSIWWLLQIAYLFFIITKSRRETKEIHGSTYIILYPSMPLAVGSFRLWHRYIIWQSALDDLTPAEREAVLWHEIAHLNECDTWLKILVGLVQPIWAMNPAYYFFNNELYFISELIADKFAVKQINNTRLYIAVLLKMKLMPQNNIVHHFATGTLKQRVLSLTQQPKNQHKSGWIVLSIIFVSLYMTGKCTQPYITQQFDKIRVYKTLAEDNQYSGRSLFCKHCLLEQLNKPSTPTIPPLFNNEMLIF